LRKKLDCVGNERNYKRLQDMMSSFIHSSFVYPLNSFFKISRYFLIGFLKINNFSYNFFDLLLEPFSSLQIILNFPKNEKEKLFYEK
jgi:hypothetical protein